MAFVGLFTDKAFCLKMIVLHPNDASKRIVYCSYYSDDERIHSKAHVHGILQMNDRGECTFVVADELVVHGHVDARLLRINWNTGDKWQNLVVSPLQLTALMYRPYVPLSILAISWVVAICQFAYSMAVPSKQKPLKIVYSTARHGSNMATSKARAHAVPYEL